MGFPRLLFFFPIHTFILVSTHSNTLHAHIQPLHPTTTTHKVSTMSATTSTYSSNVSAPFTTSRRVRKDAIFWRRLAEDVGRMPARWEDEVDADGLIDREMQDGAIAWARLVEDCRMMSRDWATNDDDDGDFEEEEEAQASSSELAAPETSDGQDAWDALVLECASMGPNWSDDIDEQAHSDASVLSDASVCQPVQTSPTTLRLSVPSRVSRPVDLPVILEEEEALEEMITDNESDTGSEVIVHSPPKVSQHLPPALELVSLSLETLFRRGPVAPTVLCTIEPGIQIIQGPAITPPPISVLEDGVEMINAPPTIAPPKVTPWQETARQLNAIVAGLGVFA